MKAIILAAGYATRLRPLTDSIAKQLLPIGGRPMMDWVCDKVDELTNEIHVVTNTRFAGDFERWASGRDGVTVHDDGTTSNDDRLGAIRDLAFVLERAGEDDDLLVIAGDNLFDFSLVDFADFWRGKGTASAVAVYDCADLELATHYGVVEVGEDDRVVSFEEKPSEPRSTLRRRPTSTTASTSRSSGATSPRAIPPTSPGDSSHGCPSVNRSTVTGSPGRGMTSAIPSNCSRPTTVGGSEQGCPRATRTRR
jgi:glucose-1-phosphate thymidylyltransferase